MKALAPNIWYALERMRDAGGLGRMVFNGIKHHKISVVEKPIWSSALFTPRNKQNIFLPGSQGCITLNSERVEQYEMLLAHEFFHGYQHAMHGLLDRAQDADLTSHILHTRLLEAGAENFSAATCFDMKHNGSPSAFKSVTGGYQLDERKLLFLDFEQAVNKNRDLGKDYWESMLAASSNGFHTYLNSPGFAGNYTERVIESYCKKIDLDIFRGTTPYRAFGKRPLNGQTAALAGEFTGYKMVNRVKLPTTSDEVFVGNIQVRQLADWAEYQRLARTLGIDSLSAQHSKQALERDTNPYKNLRLKDVFAEAAVMQRGQGKEFRNLILEIANKLSGVPEPLTGQQGFNKAVQKKCAEPVRLRVKRNTGARFG